MLKSFCLTFVLVVFAGVIYLQAGEEKPLAPEIDKPTSEKLAGIIKKLDSSDYKERKQAGDELSKLIMEVGLSLEEPLKSYLKGASAEVKDAIERRLGLFGAFDLRDYADVIGMFDALKMPDVKGRKFVLFNPGSWWQAGHDFGFSYVMGWVVAESNESITICQTGLATRTYDRKNFKLPGEWEKFKSKHPKDKPMPGEYREFEWDSFCNQSETQGKKDYFGDLERYASGGFMRPVEMSLFGFWCYRRGNIKTARKFFELAEASTADYGDHRGGAAGSTLPEIVRDSLLTNTRWRAITGANSGASFDALYSLWDTVRIFSDNETSEADEMLKYYKEMAEEEKNYKEPSKEELEKMPTEKKAEYFLYRLRYLNARQMSQPGMCSVLGMWSGIKDDQNPATKLYKLGWDALPLVIEHLDDRRPTRCMGCGRSFIPKSFYLLRYGDACLEIFTAITGKVIYKRTSSSGYMIKDGLASDAKKAAKELWEKYGKIGQEKQLLDLLESETEYEQATGTARLIELDRKKYIPFIVKLIESKPMDKMTPIIIVVAWELDNTYQEFLVKCLAVKDMRACSIAAQTLADNCASDAGARALFKRLSGMDAIKTMEEDFYLGAAVNAIALAPGDFPINASLTLMDAKFKAVRIAAIEIAQILPNKRILEKLVTILDDKSQTGGSGAFKFRICDQAVYSILEMLSYEKKYPDDEDHGTRDEFIVELKKFISENIGKFDWEKLRAEARKRQVRYR